jgi:hypothetical protein
MRHLDDEQSITIGVALRRIYRVARRYGSDELALIPEPLSIGAPSVNDSRRGFLFLFVF